MFHLIKCYVLKYNITYTIEWVPWATVTMTSTKHYLKSPKIRNKHHLSHRITRVTPLLYDKKYIIFEDHIWNLKNFETMRLRKNWCFFSQLRKFPMFRYNVTTHEKDIFYNFISFFQVSPFPTSTFIRIALTFGLNVLTCRKILTIFGSKISVSLNLFVFFAFWAMIM